MIVVRANFRNIRVMLNKIFYLSLMSFLFLYLLRGIGMITFLSGGVIMILLLTVVISGLSWGILKTRRY